MVETKTNILEIEGKKISVKICKHNCKSFSLKSIVEWGKELGLIYECKKPYCSNVHIEWRKDLDKEKYRKYFNRNHYCRFF